MYCISETTTTTQSFGTVQAFLKMPAAAQVSGTQPQHPSLALLATTITISISSIHLRTNINQPNSS